MDTPLVENPFKYLEEDHKKVADLLETLADTTERAEKTRKEVFQELFDALMLHAELEERILYPALEEVKKTHEITKEAFEEHHVIKQLLREMSETAEDSEEWTAKLKMLKENVEHHVDEEEGEMFTKARTALPQEEIDNLAAEMNAFLEEKLSA
jgi:hemerythrin-like domain-containing protein